MAKARPLSELPVAVKNMAAAAQLMPKGVVPVLADNVKREVEWQGHGYHIKGRNGKKLRLSAKVEKRGDDVRLVGGTPIGAWHIVEGGSNRHLITGAATRTTRSGRQRRVTSRARMASFAEGDAIRGKPLRIPGIGFRQWAMHPGHGPIGQPWRKAMKRSDGVVAKSLQEYAEQAFEKGWLK